MITSAEALAAPRMLQKQRFGLRHLLRVNQAGASPEDLALAARVQAVTTADEYDKAIADNKVNALFCRGVLHFGRA